ncbi:MAG: mechanosensitive ion channel family protein [Roseivirga sp.]|nr:mechanosensitive ion channel family protein [Roseivirga sp.]
MKQVATTIKQKALNPLVNSFSGVLLKVLSPFKKGDFIEIDGQLGAVAKQGLLKTTITHLDGSLATIDNSKFYSSSLHNLSTKNIIRLDLTVSLCYREDMSRAKESILSFLNQNTRILKTPAPKLHVTKLKEKFVEISIEPWCLLDSFMELDLELEDHLKLHLTSLGFQIELEELDYQNIGVTA